MKIKHLDHVWWTRGRGVHVMFGLYEEGDDGYGSMRDTPIFVESLRERDPWSGKLRSVGWVVDVKPGRTGPAVERLTVRVRGPKGRAEAMRQGLAALARLRELVA